MAFITADRVKDTSTTTGTGDITVSGGAPSGYRTFSTVLSVGDTFYYCVTGQASSEWEVGLGTYLSVNTFARTTVLASSASGSAVSFSSGTKNVFITLPANKTLQLDATASPTSGAILYGTGSMLAYTAVGTSGQFLQSNGAAAPTWAPIGSVGTSISNGTSNVNIPSSNGAVTVATNGTTAITVDTSQNVTVANTVAMGSSFKRNRIINGNMLIDQRNAGASVTPASGAYTLDRWQLAFSQGSKLSCQQSSTSGFGFTKYALITVASTATIGASDYFQFTQPIEGFNIADLGWGASGAKSVTLSFWAYSSVAGTFGGVFKNNGGTRSYPFTYTLSASTWTYVTITVAGDTTGTWATDNTKGLEVGFSLGMGSTYSGTAGAWSANNYGSATGATSIMGTAGATFALTGVQLEVGTKATPYEMQIYSDQLAQCQRYYETGYNIWSGYTNGSSNYYFSTSYKVTKRTAATLSFSGISASGFPTSSPTVGQNDTQQFRADPTSNGLSTAGYYQFTYAAAAEL